MADNGRHSGNHPQQPLDTSPMARVKSDRREGWSRGPRSLFLSRCDNGFGFTLRHFIVYPPESYTVLQGDHRLGLHHGRQGAALDEPMDTIFVKHVRENSPAHTAGLATGDRIISVNGETITGHSYAQVVQLIQQSGSFLHLLVVPKEDDILQLYFGETAHNPETNQRPLRVKSPDLLERRNAAGASIMLQQHPVPQQASHHHSHHHSHHRHHRPVQQHPGEPSSTVWSTPPLDSVFIGSENCGTSAYRGSSPDYPNNQAAWYRPQHHRSSSNRRSSEGSGTITKREAIYGYARNSPGNDLRILQNDPNQYYSTPSRDRRISADNAAWSRSPGVSSVFQPLRVQGDRRLISKDMVFPSATASSYPVSNLDRNLLTVQHQHMVVTPTPSDSMASSRYGSSENVHGSSNSLHGLYYPGSAGCRLSLDGGRRESSVSLPSSSIHDNFTSDGSKDSLLSYDSTSTLTGGQEGCSSDDSLIMSRIRKSFEQKEEFLRRPNQPISWNLPENTNQQQHTIPLSTHAQAIIAREFYARPQKFQRPVWPPPSPSLSPSPSIYRQQSPSRISSSSGKTQHSNAANNRPTHQNLRRVKSDIDSERDSQLPRSGSIAEDRSMVTFERASSEPCEDYTKTRGQFLCGGPVTNVPPPVINKAGYNQSLSIDGVGPAQFRPITPVASSAQGGNRHMGSKTSPFITMLPRIHENIPALDPSGDYSSSNYGSSNLSDGYDQYSNGGGIMSLPPSLPSSPAVDLQQFSRSLSSPTEENGGNGSGSRYPTHPMLQLVSRRARQFETGLLDDEEINGCGTSDRTSLYRSELSRLSAKKSVPNVALRKREFESRSGAGSGGSGRDSRKPNRESRSLESADPPPSAHDDVAGGSVRLRARSNSAESWAAAMGASRNRSGQEWPPSRAQETQEPKRNKAVRQDSYLAAVRMPVNTDRPSRLMRQAALSLDEELEEHQPILIPVAATIPAMTPSAPILSIRPPSPTLASPIIRPNQLTIPNPLRPAEPVASLTIRETSTGEADERQDDIGRLVTGLDSIPSAPVSTVAIALGSNAGETQTSPNMAPVVMRQKPQHSIADEERVGRRVSYLKATWSDRMHVDSDLDLSDCESPHMTHRSGIVIGSQTNLDQAGQSQPLRLDGNKENLNILREGWLHCKITVVDGKRAGDRSWKQVWAVLRGPLLGLYKERRDLMQHQTPMASGDGDQLDTRGCQVEVAGDYTKKKHVVRLNTLSGSELLLQAEDAADMALWLQALQHGDTREADSAGSGNGKQSSSQYQATAGGPSVGVAGSRLSPLPTNKGIRKLTTSFRNRSPTGQSPVNKTRKPSQTDQLPSPKTKTWKGRVAKQFRRIQHGAGSPSSPTAPHPEGVTIGIPLEDCPPSTCSEFVPLLVELCTSVVDSRGLDIIGIYRVPGNTAAVSALTESVNKGFEPTSIQDPRWNDVNVISSLLKLFFRRLPDPLLTTDLYPSFIEADKIEDPNRRIITIRKLVHELPDHHFETLKFLMFHLKKVVEHCDSNKMEARNLAIVFGPTLVHTADENMVTMVTDMSHQCRIVESLISHVDWFFSDEDVDDSSSFLFNIPQESDLEPAAVNQNLLLSNISKVEGMKGDSPNRDISAKDIVSSIISAANRKMQKAKSRKGGSSGGGGSTTAPEDGRETFTESGDHSDNKQMMESKLKDREVVVVSADADESTQQPQSSAVASSILESMLLSGTIVKHAAEGETEPENTRVAELSGNHSEELSSQELQRQALVARKMGGIAAGSDEVAIRTYAGLSATTKERIRRFELETKAMLQRDQTRHRHELERREADKRRIELEWQQAKRDLESEDLLDEIADNPSDITKKMSATETEQPLAENSKQISPLSHRLTSSPTSNSALMSSSPAAVLTRTLQQHQSSSQASSPRDEQDLRRFTQTKKVGNTHFFPESPKGAVTAPISQPGVLSSVTPTTTHGTDIGYPPASTPGTRSLELVIRSNSRSLCSATNRATLPSPSMQALQQPLLRRGNSVENIQVQVGQASSTHKAAPNGTLKRLKTGNEQNACQMEVPGQAKTQPLGSLRCGSLDSLQDAFSGDGRDRPRSDVSDDGSDLLASLTSTFDRKLKSLLNTTPTSETTPHASMSEVSAEISQETKSPAIKQNQDADMHKPLATTPDHSDIDQAAQEVPATSVDNQTAPMKKTVFRDPSLHRGRAPPLERQGRVEQQELADNRAKKSQNSRCQETDGSRGRSREVAGDRKIVAEQKAVLSSVNDKSRGDEKYEEQKEVKENSTKLKRSESLTKTEKTDSTSSTKLRRSESLTKAEKGEMTNTKLKRSESLTKAEKVTNSNTKLRRSESLTKAEKAESSSNTKLKRSDSLTKTEKTESNNSKRKQDMLISGSSFRSSNRGCNKEKENVVTILTKLKRKNGMPEHSIKRRHTVGGTKDFDKLNWLDNRLQQEQQEESEAANGNKERRCLRTSSPDLSSSRLGCALGRERFLVEISLLGSGGIMAELRQQLAPNAGRPHSLPDPNLASRVFKVPLESHV